MLVLHVGVKSGIGSVGLSTALTADVVFGDLLVLPPVYFLHKKTRLVIIVHGSSFFRLLFESGLQSFLFLHVFHSEIQINFRVTAEQAHVVGLSQVL